MNINQLHFLYNILRNMAPYYAVARGRNVGIFKTWDECRMQVHQYPKAIFKKFATKAEAENFIVQKSNVNQQYGDENSATKLTKRLRVSKAKSVETINEASSSKKRKTSNADEHSKFVYDSATKKTNGEYITDNDGYVNVYTDGACSSNGGRNARAGIGVWFGDDHPLNVSQPVIGRATNNMAEIQAVTVAAKQAKNAGIKKLKINTDSKFLISCITNWMSKWKTNGWKTSNNMPVINKTELLEMEEALKSLNVTWNHVNGHVGIYGNEMADKLARAGCLKY